MTDNVPISLCDANSDMHSTVLAWSQAHLKNYTSLSLLHEVKDLKESWIDGSAFLCLAHCFFADSLPNFTQLLHSKHTEDCLAAACTIFTEKLHIDLGNPTNLFHDESATVHTLSTVRDAILEKQAQGDIATVQSLTVRQLDLVAETQHIKITRRTREASGAIDEVFDKKATAVLHKIAELRSQLNEMVLSATASRTPVTTASSATEEREDVSSEPADAATRMSPATPNAMDDLVNTMQLFEANLSALHTQVLADFSAYVATMPEDTRTQPGIASRMLAVDNALDALNLQLQEDFEGVRMGVLFAQLTTPIRNELDFIQAKMLKTTTTEDGIRDLEERVRNVDEMVRRIEADYSHLVPVDSQDQQSDNPSHGKYYRAHFDMLIQKYKMICSWVDDVRVWFTEAERIRNWIKEKIQWLENLPAIDALSDVHLSLSVDEIDTLNREHEALEKEVEELDRQDVARLRAHVKELTGTDRQNRKDLSPADTTTIEITFTTLMTLDRLLHLLRRRRYALQILTLRSLWEQEHVKTVAWLQETDIQVRSFISKGARWHRDDDTVGQQEEDHTSKPELRRDAIIDSLITFEKKLSEFNQGQFSATIDAYQDLDETSNTELPSFLELRQISVEDGFEDLNTRVAFARRVVEQHLNVADFMQRAKVAMAEGEAVQRDILAACQHPHDGGSDRSFTDRVQAFQEQQIPLVMAVALRIPYPDTPFQAEKPDNDEANQIIRAAVDDCRTALIALGDAIDQTLDEYRTVLRLQKGAKQLQDDMCRLGDWLEERIKAVKSTKVDIFVGKCAMDEADLAQLIRDSNGQIAKVKGFQENDFNGFKNILQSLKDDVQATQVNTVQLEPLDLMVQWLDSLFITFDKAMAQHTLCLNILGKRIAWEFQHTKLLQWVSTMTQKVWSLSQRVQWRPIIDGNCDNAAAEELHDRTELNTEFDNLQSKITEFSQNDFKQVSASFDDMSQGFQLVQESIDDAAGDESVDNRYADEIELTTKHVKRRQDMLLENFNHLQASARFTLAILDQRLILQSFTVRCKEIQRAGININQALERAASDKTYTENPPSFQAAIQDYDQKVSSLWSECGMKVPYPVCPDGAWASRLSTEDDDIATEIKAFVSQEYDKLLQIGKRMRELDSQYCMTIVFKQTIQKLVSDIAEQDLAIKDVRQAVLDDKQDIAIDSRNVIESHGGVMDNLRARHQDRSTTIATITSNVASLKGQHETLSKSVSDADFTQRVDTGHVAMQMDTLAADLESLKHAHNVHSQELDIQEGRIQWETLWRENQATLDRLQESVRTIAQKKNLYMTNDPTEVQHSQSHLSDLGSQARDIGEQLNALEKSKSMADMDSVFTDLVQRYKTMAESIRLPPEMEEQQREMIVNVKRLRDAITSLQDEIDVLTKRAVWEAEIAKQLCGCDQVEKKVNLFIQQRVQWAKEITSGSGFNDAAKCDLETLKASAESLSIAVAALVEPQHISSICTGGQTTGMTLSADRIDAIKASVTKMGNRVMFAQQVVDQYNDFAACMADAMNLEKTSLDIKDSILSGDDADTCDSDKEAIASYETGVSLFCEALGTRVPYPVYNDEQFLEQDNNANAAIREILQACETRLQASVSHLHDLLKSKNNMSQRKAAMTSYMSEVQAIQSWIQQRSAAVQQALQMLDGDTCSVANVHSGSSAIEAVVSSIGAYENAITSLQHAANKYATIIQLHKDTDTSDDSDDELKTIHDSLTTVEAMWNELKANATDASERFSCQKRRIEYNGLVEKFYNGQRELETSIIKQSRDNISQLTESDIAQWKSKLENLHTNFVRVIHNLLSSEQEQKSCGNQHIINEDLDAMQSDCNQIDAAFHDLGTLLADATREFKNYGLRQEFEKYTSTLEAFLGEETQKLLSIMHDGISEDTTLQTRHAKIVQECERIEQDMKLQSIQYEEEQSLYQMILLQKFDDEKTINERQTQLDTDWKVLSKTLSEAKKYGRIVEQWINLHGALNDVETALEQEQQEDNEIYAQKRSNLQKVHARLASAKALTEKLNGADIPHNDAIMTSFVDCHKRIEAKLIDFAAKLDQDEKNAQKLKESDDFCQQTNALADQALLECKAVSHRMDGTLIKQQLGNDAAASVNGLHRSIATANAHSNNIYLELQSRMNQLASQAQALKEKFNDLNLDEAINHAAMSLQDLENAIRNEAELSDYLRRMLGHIKSSDSILAWIDNCHLAIADLSNNADYAEDRRDAETEIANLEEKIQGFERVIQSFGSLTESVVQGRADETGSADPESAIHQLCALTVKRAEKVDQAWKELGARLLETKTSAARGLLAVAIVRKLKHTTSLIGHCRDHVRVLRLYDRKGDPTNDDDMDDTSDIPLENMLHEHDIIAVERELKNIEINDNQQIDREIVALDKLISEFDDKEATFTQQRKEIDTAVASFRSMLAGKKEQILRALDLAKYLTISNDIDVLMGGLDEAVIKAVPRSTVAGGSLSRVDTQAKLIELDARYKYYKHKIVQSLEATQLAIEDITDEHDRDRVHNHAKQLQARWEELNKRVKARRDELQRLVDEGPTANPTALVRQGRLRKSSLPTRKASQFLQDREGMAPTSAPSPSQSNTSTSSRISTSSRLRPMTSIPSIPLLSSRLVPSSSSPRPTGRQLPSRSHFATPPSSSRASKSASSIKPPAIHVHKAACPPPPPPPNKYVADPDNDLDMEIGRIVNQAPYEIKVKMVPGETGRYWFGDVNPKLAYCRVLKSKMVMVRVGGGWVELSQFLRDHALLEGDFIPKSRMDDSLEPALPSIQEGFIETRRAKSPLSGRPVPRTRNRSLSPNPPMAPSKSSPLSQRNGYMDGDRYIAVDSNGNELEVKVTPAGAHDNIGSISSDYRRRRQAAKTKEEK